MEPAVVTEPVRPLLPETEVTVPLVRDDRQLVVPVIQTLAASMPPAKVEVAVVVAMSFGTVSESVPVAWSWEPFQVSIKLETGRFVRSNPIEPAVVTDPVRPLFVLTEVTVPVLLVRQVPPIDTQPPYGRLIPAKVDVAVVEA